MAIRTRERFPGMVRQEVLASSRPTGKGRSGISQSRSTQRVKKKRKGCHLGGTGEEGEGKSTRVY